jgi:hypothetical protein
MLSWRATKTILWVAHYCEQAKCISVDAGMGWGAQQAAGHSEVKVPIRRSRAPTRTTTTLMCGRTTTRACASTTTQPSQARPCASVHCSAADSFCTCAVVRPMPAAGQPLISHTLLVAAALTVIEGFIGCGLQHMPKWLCRSVDVS